MTRSSVTRRTTATGARSAAAAPARRRRQDELEVLPRTPGRGVRVLAVLGMVLAFAVVFGLVAFHAVLAAQQDQLDRARADVAEARAQHADLRLEVATLSSPERIVSVAEQRLGMVQPREVAYLQPILESDLGLVPAAPVAPAGD